VKLRLPAHLDDVRPETNVLPGDGHRLLLSESCHQQEVIHDFGTTFKAYRREAIQSVPLYREMHRFIPALASWYGASICEIPIRNVNRENGKSHYGIARTFRVFFDLLTIRFLLRYMSRPLHFFDVLGAFSIMAGSFLSAILFAMKAISPQQDTMSLHGPIFVIAAILVLSGVQLLSIGLLAVTIDLNRSGATRFTNATTVPAVALPLGVDSARNPSELQSWWQLGSLPL
jgi:hypothetical protein